jgi:Carboxypeptidase regulatory-like domain
MQRRNTWTAVPVLTVFALTACGGGGEKAADNPPAQTEAPAAAAPAAVENAATLNVSVAFTGTPPAAKTIDMSEEKVCADKHAAAGGAKTEEVVVNNGKLQNVFVYVKEGLTGTSAAPTDNVVIDQDGCEYKPHVSGVVVGQGLVFKNSDGILHNVKAVPTANRGFNISQPTAGDAAPKTFATKEVMVPVECNVHGWMKSYVGVLDHPYFAVSGNDGSAKIGNLPPGTYTIEAWHEKYGTQTQSVTVGPNETKDITFTFSAKTATKVPLGKPLIVHPVSHPSL